MAPARFFVIMTRTRQKTDKNGVNAAISQTRLIVRLLAGRLMTLSRDGPGKRVFVLVSLDHPALDPDGRDVSPFGAIDNLLQHVRRSICAVAGLQVRVGNICVDHQRIELKSCGKLADLQSQRSGTADGGHPE